MDKGFTEIKERIDDKIDKTNEKIDKLQSDVTEIKETSNQILVVINFIIWIWRYLKYFFIIFAIVIALIFFSWLINRLK